MGNVDDFLAHYGVKGMKWGVRRDAGHEGERAKTKTIERMDRKFEKDASSLSTAIRLHNKAAELSNKNDVDRINNDPKYKSLDHTRDSPLRQQYYKAHQDAFVTNLKKAADEIGSNASGTKKYGIYENPNGSWDVTIDEIKHADTQERFTVKVEYDKGRIVRIVPPEDDLEQSEAVGDFLAHYGVKGMRWGKRKASDSGGGSGGEKLSVKDRLLGGKKEAPSDDAADVKELQRRVKRSGVDSLSNAELQSLVTRMNLQQQHTKLNTKKTGAGTKFIQQQAQQLAQKELAAAFKGELGPVSKTLKTTIDIVTKKL